MDADCGGIWCKQQHLLNCPSLLQCRLALPKPVTCYCLTACTVQACENAGCNSLESGGCPRPPYITALARHQNKASYTVNHKPKRSPSRIPTISQPDLTRSQPDPNESPSHILKTGVDAPQGLYLLAPTSPLLGVGASPKRALRSCD